MRENVCLCIRQRKNKVVIYTCNSDMNKAGLAVYDVHSCLVWCMIFFMHIRHCHKIGERFYPSLLPLVAGADLL